MRKGLITVEFGELVNLGKDKFNPMTNANLPCIELEHIDSGTGTIKGSVDSREQKSLKNVFHKGDILFSKLRPYLRKYWFADFDGVCSSEIWVLKPKEIVLPHYLFYLIQTEEFIRISNVSFGSKMPRADWDFINHYPLTIIHSLSEQQRIVSVLSLWDTAIAKQTALIEQLTLRKRGLMQQLLTGKKRLKGFGGEWKEVRLGEIGVFFKGGGVPKDKITNSGNKCLTYGDLYTKYDFVISDVKSYIDDHTANESVKIRYGDICFAGSGETKEDIGKCAAFIDNEYGYAGGDIIVFRANDCNPITLSYILNSSDVIRQKSNMGQGHSVVHIYPYQLEKLLIKLPSRAEQDAIATILMESDKEIEIQKQKLAAMQAQKKGLMQVLLTGKKRINNLQ